MNLLSFSFCQVDLDNGWFVPKEKMNIASTTTIKAAPTTATAKKDECIVLDDDDAPMKPANTAHANKKKVADREDEEIVIVSEPILAENPFPSGK